MTVIESMEQTSSNNRSTFFRFSLRTLLVASLLIAVLVGWGAKRRAANLHDERTASELQKLGVRCQFIRTERVLPLEFSPVRWADVTVFKIDMSFIEEEDELHAIELIGELQHVEQIILRTSQPDLRSFPSLEKLRVLELSWADSLNGIERMPNLNHLYLYDADNIESFEPLRNLKKLESIYTSLEDSSVLKIKEEDISSLVNLRRVEIQACEMTSLAGFRNLKHIQIIEIDHSNEIDIAAISGNRSLKRISLPNCANLKNLDCFSQMDELVELNLFNCASLIDVSGVANLKRLKEIYITGCPSNIDLSTIKSNRLLKQHIGIKRGD